MKLYQNRDWLYQKYCNERLSTYKIGRLCKVRGVSIGYWLHKFNIARQEKYKNRDWLYQKYIVEKLSTVKISIIGHCHYKTISDWLKKYNIRSGIVST